MKSIPPFSGSQKKWNDWQTFHFFDNAWRVTLRLPQFNESSWFWDWKSKNKSFLRCKSLKLFSELSGCLSWILVVWRKRTESLFHANIKNSVFVQIFMRNICFDLTAPFFWRWIKHFEEPFFCGFERFACLDWSKTVQKEVSKLH